MQLVKGIALPPVAQQWVERLGGERRLALLGVGVGSVLLILGLAHWATRPTWMPIYTDLPLESVGAITDRLDDAGIRYRIENGGAQLMVTTDDLARARVTLAREGGLPDGGRPGLELFDQPSWGMTDFTQRINYRRALEGELERTIGKMRGVAGAQVHLAMDNAPTFRSANRPLEASVVLKLRSGAIPAPEVVRGIQHLVSSSVDGVESERVTVLDDSGQLLSNPHLPGSMAGVASQELQTRREIERYLEAKAVQLLSQIAGGENVRVQVSADVSFDRVERMVETVDPERQVIASEQRAEIIPGAEGGAGSTNLTATCLNSRTVENFQGALGAVRRLSVAVLLNERVGGEAGAWTPERMEHVEALVARAVGLSMDRGDDISVVSIPFEEPLQEEPVDAWTLVETFHKPALTLVALLLAFGVAMRALRTVRGPEAPVAAALPAPEATDGAGEGDEEDDPAALAPGEDDVLFGHQSSDEHQMLLSRAAAMRTRMAAHVQERPEEAARVIRAWLKEA